MEVKGKKASRPISALKRKNKNTRSTVTPERSKTRRHKSQTKEELYEEVLKFQREVDLLRKENSILKAQLKQAEDDLCSDDRTISRLIKKMKTKHGSEMYSTSTHLVLSLIHICRCRRYAVCRSRWSPYH
eukprot:TRINITY_DN17035_c0_g3_i3.p2 TRINITY_DN17035_c0_g3~~TRINITY_DN17035_c0_g3_i3.p2  ORF type:complete len:130 (-),score=19.36 TRINITY_DN17035_c0_g3_i3:13-402(-)